MESGGQTNQEQKTQEEAQRETAAAIARRKVLAAYANTNQKQELKQAEQHIANESKEHQAPQSKIENVQPRINSESWKKYHSAWQDYYQKYYSAYYSKAAKTYIENEKLKAEREYKEEQEILNAAKQNQEQTSSIISDDLRQRIRKKAVKNVKKTRRFKHLVPILAGVAIVLVILFMQYNRLIFAPIMAYMSPGNAPASEIEAINPALSTNVSPDPKLIIPKLNVDVPIHFGLQLSQVMSAMNNGVAHYQINGADALPGEVGNFIVTGHSAGDVYSNNPYKYIFSGLERLENGDTIYVNYNSTRYTYSVTKKEVIEPSNVAALVVDTDVPILTLVTCTPLGTSRYRLLVTAEQVSPAFDQTTASSSSSSTSSEETSELLPSNEPSFFERIWNWLTGN